MKFLSDAQSNAQHETLRRTIKAKFQGSSIFEERLGGKWNPYFIMTAEVVKYEMIINT